MKWIALAFATTLGCAVALGQGKIHFGNDSLHLVYYGFMPGADAALSGQCVDSTQMPSGVTLVADLYVGTSSPSLAFISSTMFSATPGILNGLSVQLPGIPGGETVFVVTIIRDQAFAPVATFNGVFSLGTYGASQEFAFTLGSGILYPPMWGTNGNWAIGTRSLDQYGVGSKGAINISLIPEPASLALAGLGAAALIIFRCRR